VSSLWKDIAAVTRYALHVTHNCIIIPFQSVIYKMASRSRKRIRRKQLQNGIPFASGFQKPTEKQSERATGLSESERCCREYQIGEEKEFFELVPRPSSIDDWLAQYDEEGQHFKSFLSTCPGGEGAI
jgi:hypothetical protein